MQLSPEDEGPVKIMASIGNVCLQWSLLEQTILVAIAQVESLPLEKVYLMFGSLDMLPRLHMAINLVEHASAPLFVRQRLRAIRTAIRDERLDDKRNQVVHGVHADADNPEAVRLTMPRWGKPKREQTVSVHDIHCLGKRLHELATEAHAICQEIVQWQLRMQENRLKHAERQAAEANTPALFKLAKRLYARVKNAWR